MTAPAAASYRIVCNDDEHSHRISAVDSRGNEIAGAYRPQGLNDWRIYVCKNVIGSTGLLQPHKVHACSRVDATRWVDLIAFYYVKAMS
jgi:hypothetical protein